MGGFNPYLVDEIITQTDRVNDYFGLISERDVHRTELHGYEITLSGKIAVPELHPQQERETQKADVC